MQGSNDCFHWCMVAVLMALFALILFFAMFVFIFNQVYIPHQLVVL